MPNGWALEDLFWNPSFLEVFHISVIILQLTIYILYAYFQYVLSKKLEVKYSWMAWIPVLSFFNKLFIAGKTIWWWTTYMLLPVLVAGLWPFMIGFVNAAMGGGK
jgi:hypothetical protein